MLLIPERSHCKINQKIIVSKDKGSQREHRAENPRQQYKVRHYKLDGELVQNRTCCDFLLVNDSGKKAYFIELKGGHIEDAIRQLEKGADICRPELSEYDFYYRIVSSKVRTHNVQKSAYRKFKDRHGSRIKCQTGCMEEVLL